MLVIRTVFVDATAGFTEVTDPEVISGLVAQDFFDRDLTEIAREALSPFAAVYLLTWAYRGPDKAGIGVRASVEEG
jgi:hypothetical protein